MNFDAIDALIDSESKTREQERQASIDLLDKNLESIVSKEKSSYPVQLAANAVSGFASYVGTSLRSSPAQLAYNDFFAPKEDQPLLRANQEYQKIDADYEARKMRHRNIVKNRSIDPNSSRPSLVDWSKEYRKGFKYGEYEDAVNEAYNQSVALVGKNEGFANKPEDTWPVTPQSLIDADFEENVVAKESPAVSRRYKALRGTSEKFQAKLTPEWVERASSWSQDVEHSEVGKMFLDAAQNVNNLGVSLAGKGIDRLTSSPVGSMMAYGAFSMQEEGNFIQGADPLVENGLPVELAEKYAREYGAIAGAIEYSEQALNVATLGGAGKTMELIGAKLGGKTVLGKFAKWVAGKGLDATGEGLEELSQQALQYYTMERMLGEWADKKGKKGFSGELDKLQFPVDPATGEVDWSAAQESLWQSFKTGAGVSLALGAVNAPRAAVSGVKNVALSEVKKTTDTLDQIRLNEEFKKLVDPDSIAAYAELEGVVNQETERQKLHNEITASDADAWMKDNQAVLPDIAKKDSLSRSDWEEIGLPRVPKWERDKFLQRVKSAVENNQFPAYGRVVPPSAKVEEKNVLPLNAETQAQVEKVQEEIAAQEAVVEGSGINEAVVEPVVEPTKKKTPSEIAAKRKAIREANAPKPAKTEPSVVPVASEPVVAPEVAPEAAKPVDEAVAKRKRGKKVKEVAQVDTAPDEKLVANVKAMRERDANIPAVLESEGMIIRKAKAPRTQAAEEKLRAEGWKSYLWRDGADAPTEDVLGTVWAKPAKKGNKIAPQAQGDVSVLSEIHDRAIATELQPIATKETVATEVAITDTAKAKKQGKAAKPVVKESLTVQPTAPAPVKVEDNALRDAVLSSKSRADVKESPVEEVRPVRGTIAERRADAILDKTNKLDGFGLETRRELMEKVAKGEIPWRVEMDEVEDHAARKKDEAIVDRVRSKYILSPKDKTRGSNPNIPEVKSAYDAIDRLEAGYKKAQYRLVNTERGNFYDISKTEYDYAKSLEADAPVKVETEPVLDSKGRSPERLAQMAANARALKEASAKEGMLPKKQGRKATKYDNAEVASELEKLGWTLAEDNTYQKRVILEDGSSATKSIVFGGNALVLQSGLDDDVKSKIGETPAETATLVDELSKKAPKASGQFMGMPKQTVFNSIEVEPEGKEETVEPISRSEVIGVMRKEFPGLAIRGRGTWRRKNAQGWFDKANSLIRTNDPYSVGVVSHELGHYIGELSKAMKMKMPTSVSDELVKMGARIYPDKVPVGGYKNEGWAEFIRGWLTASEEMESVCPNTLTWFNSVWMPAHPKSGTSLMKIQAAVKNLRAQTPEQAVRAFWNHKDAGILPSSLSWIRSHLNYHEWVDKYHFLLTDMQAAGIDIDVMKPGLSKEERAQAIINHPYLKATLYNKSAGRRVTEMALRGTTNLVGNKSTGESLYDALDGIRGDSDRLANWKDYAVARQALEYHKRGMKSGLTDAQIEATIKKFRSPEFDRALERVTQWSRRVLHLLVENGAMTQEEFDTIEEMNPIYVKFMRRFEEESVKRGSINKGKPVKKRRGGSQDIEDPVAGMLVDAQRIIQSAQQADIARCIVLAAKNAKEGSFIAENWIVKVPAPQEATEFEAERIKRFVADVALDKMGADPDMVQEELAKEWKEKLTIFRAATSFKGKDKILAIVLDGERTYYEVKDERLFDLLDGYSKPTENSDIRILNGKIVSGIRLGATMLNPRFGMIRNPARDTLTAFMFADYHTHVPVASLVAGVAQDLLGTDTSQVYHAMGLDLDTLSGRNLKSAKHLSRQVQAANTFKRDMKGGVVHTVASILSHSEVGPRIMEFKGARDTWMQKTGSDEAASIMAGLASGDMTVNFRRSGKTGGKVSEVVLFFNAGVQSVDKFLREIGAIKALPWEAQQNRGKRLVRTVARAGLAVTAQALLSYAWHRDEEWWKELPPSEKWGNMHWKIGGEIVRIPLPFEPGMFFGSLPIAILEEPRTQGSIAECLSLMVDNLPIQIGGFHDLVRNITAIAPIADVGWNRTWNGAQLVPENMKRTRQPVDWASSNTGETAKFLGEQIWKAVEGTRFEEMAAPILIEHVLNQYSGGMYKMLSGSVENIKDPSIIGASGDLSTLPLVGTLFMREGTSRISNDFYDRIEELNRLYGSKKITLEDFGELRAKQGVAGDLTDMFDRRREVMKDALKKRGEIKVETDKIINDILDKIREHNKKKEHFRTLGIRSAVMGITEPSALRESRVYLASLLKDVSLSEAQQQLTTQSLLLGRKTSGDAFRERIMLLNDYMQQAQE